MAILASVVAMGFGSKTAKPKDFMPKFEPTKKQTPQDMMRVARMMAKRQKK